MSVEHDIRFLLHDRSAVMSLFKRLNSQQIRWALYAGCETALLAANRIPTDIDIIVHDEDFEATAFALQELNRYDNQPEVVVTADGQEVGFVCSGIVGRFGSTDVDIMSQASFEIDSKTYPIRLTDNATANRLVYRYENTDVFLANPFDTILIKAFMRRGPEQNKFDKHDAEALASVVSIDKKYSQQRLKEVGATEEVLAFLHDVNAG